MITPLIRNADQVSTETYVLSLHDALPICQMRTEIGQLIALLMQQPADAVVVQAPSAETPSPDADASAADKSEEHTSELQSRGHIVFRLLLEKKTKKGNIKHVLYNV